MSYGGIEAGGSKWVCAVGDSTNELIAVETFPTTTPTETIGRAVQFFAGHRRLIDGLGVGSFGPVDVHESSPSWGQITTTPKPGWAHTDVVAALQAALELPVAFDTDVNAAALAEAQWGAGSGLQTFCYVTVGTGIGVGVVANGRLLHGLLHPEVGHMRIPHDRARDPFEGVCPFHGDCWEGLASGVALRQRWGRPAHDLSTNEAWELEADYLALGLVNLICTISPQRIIVGGGVAKHPGLLRLVGVRVRDLLDGYLNASEVSTAAGIEQYIVAPALGDHAGVLGAIKLAQLRAPVKQTLPTPEAVADRAGRTDHDRRESPT
jgi:fructokinase